MSNPFNEVRMGPVDVHIGKNGITSGLIEHITNILQKKKIIKIKVLREEAHEVTVDRIIATVLQQIKAVVLDVRGFTFILAKKPVPGVHLPKKYQNLETLLQSLTDQPLPLASSVKEDEDLEDFEDEDLDNEDLDQTDTKLKSSSDNDTENDNCEEGEAPKTVEHVDFEQLDNTPEFQHYQQVHSFQEEDYIDYDDEELLEKLDNEENPLSEEELQKILAENSRKHQLAVKKATQFKSSSKKTVKSTKSSKGKNK